MPTRIGLTGLADRLLGRLDTLFGRTSELDAMSQQVTALKTRAYSDEKLTPAELEAIQARMADIEARFAKYAAAHGYPIGEARPATPQSFKIYQEQQEIHFEWFAGKDLKSGALGELLGAIRGGDQRRITSLTTRMGFDIAASSNAAIARDKVQLLRAGLATIDDRKTQLAVLAAVRGKLEQELKSWPAGAKPPPLSLAEFDTAATFETPVSMHKVTLPPEVAGNDKIFPNKPIPGWEAQTRAATHAALDDLEKAGQLFIDKIPAGAGTANVAVKVDLNFGADGPPSVSDPTETGATIAELLERSAAQGKSIHLTVGDSCGGENIPLGRTTMDIMRNTGNYHHALKAGLAFAAKNGDAAAQASLDKIVACEARGVFFGSKDDKVSTPADLAAAEQAAQKYVTCVDYDKAGFVKVDPELGPLGLSAWGTKDFQIAKPWAEADYRVHVPRGLSTHLLAGWTGSQKGLIGLHAFGLRPFDQGMDKRGVNPIDFFPLVAGGDGFASFLSQRTGIIDVVARIAALGDPQLSAQLAKATREWASLSDRKEAWASYVADTKVLAGELKRDQAVGMDQAALMDKMRWRMRAALDKADGLSPGFRQQLFDAASDGTRAFLRIAFRFRELAPPEMRDEQMGMRIGLLTQLPYQSDLVVKSQPKIGEGGGPDSYDHVTDVGVVIAGTNEAATDAAAWKAAGKTGNLWSANWPLYGSLVFGGGPMHQDEIHYL
jgi:hypothetical protein